MEDGCPNLPDGVVEIGHKPVQPSDDGLIVDQRGQALHTQAGGEQPLDNVIMKVSSDSVPVLEHGEALLVCSGLDQLPGQGGLIGERFGHVLVGGSEVASS